MCPATAGSGANPPGRSERPEHKARTVAGSEGPEARRTGVIRRAIVIAALAIGGIGGTVATSSASAGAAAAASKVPYSCYSLHYGAAANPKGEIYALIGCDGPHNLPGTFIEPTGDCLQVGSHRAGPFVDDGCVYFNDTFAPIEFRIENDSPLLENLRDAWDRQMEAAVKEIQRISQDDPTIDFPVTGPGSPS